MDHIPLVDISWMRKSQSKFVVYQRKVIAIGSEIFSYFVSSY